MTPTEKRMREILAEEVEKAEGPADIIAALRNPWMEEGDQADSMSASLSAMRRARDEALEEVAKVCEGKMTCGCNREDCYTDRIPEGIAKNIRALKSTGEEG